MVPQLMPMYTSLGPQGLSGVWLEGQKALKPGFDRPRGLLGVGLDFLPPHLLKGGATLALPETASPQLPHFCKKPRGRCFLFCPWPGEGAIQGRRGKGRCGAQVAGRPAPGGRGGERRVLFYQWLRQRKT